LLKNIEKIKNDDQNISCVKPHLQLCRTLKLNARISKFFAALLIIFKIPTKLFW